MPRQPIEEDSRIFSEGPGALERNQLIRKAHRGRRCRDHAAICAGVWFLFVEGSRHDAYHRLMCGLVLARVLLQLVNLLDEGGVPQRTLHPVVKQRGRKIDSVTARQLTT